MTDTYDEQAAGLLWNSAVSRLDEATHQAIAARLRADGEAIRVLVEGVAQLSALIGHESWCIMGTKGKCTCGMERDHLAIIETIKANPTARAAVEGGKT